MIQSATASEINESLSQNEIEQMFPRSRRNGPPAAIMMMLMLMLFLVLAMGTNLAFKFANEADSNNVNSQLECGISQGSSSLH